jgi:hypothetical protein
MVRDAEGVDRVEHLAVQHRLLTLVPHPREGGCGECAGENHRRESDGETE